MKNNKAVEVLREMKLSAENPENTCWLFNNNRDEAINEALLALEFSDCVEFGYWLVNAPNKEIHSKKWIEQKYQQYLKEKKASEVLTK